MQGVHPTLRERDPAAFGAEFQIAGVTICGGQFPLAVANQCLARENPMTNVSSKTRTALLFVVETNGLAAAL